MKKKPTSVASINPSRWAAYAAAGAATALSGTQSVEADVTHVVVNQLVLGTPTATYTFALAGAATFQVNHNAAGFAGFLINAPGTDGFVGSVGGGTNQFRYVSKFSASGVNVSTAGAFIQNVGTAVPGTLASLIFGQWITPGAGFAAIKFNSGAGTQYGWVRFNMNGAGAANSFTLVDYAYADVGEQIATGQIPEPGTLGLLALGAVGLLAWRKKRSGAIQG